RWNFSTRKNNHMSIFNIPRNKTQPWLSTEIHKVLEKIFGYFLSVIGMEDLADVTVTNPADGDVLEYDSTTDTWRNTNRLGAVPVELLEASDQIEDYVVQGTTKILLIDGNGYDLTGISAVKADASSFDNGDILVIKNVGSSALTVIHASVASLESNRINMVNNTDLVLSPGEEVKLVYEGNADGWEESGSGLLTSPTITGGSNVSSVGDEMLLYS